MKEKEEEERPEEEEEEERGGRVFWREKEREKENASPFLHHLEMGESESEKRVRNIWANITTRGNIYIYIYI